MGTVGLSFGTPTSGTGFNVSATVAEIVGNLQNVETPWKNQLASLQQQDTVISSLGTMFSNLSTDISNLTDFQGVMAQKAGSSSDPNVLALTSADSSAAAGTYTVEVGSLAKTASGYMTQVTDPNAKLSGAITLQAASGAALTITINSTDNTLAGLEATINASGVGITANVLGDGSGSVLSLVSNTSGANGNITVSGNTLVATSSKALSYNGAPGTVSTASTGTLGALTSPGDTLSGNLIVQVGSGTNETIVIGSAPLSGAAANTIYTGSSSGYNTLTGLESAINGASLGVTASTGSNGSLQLTANAVGTSSNLTVTSNIFDNTPTSLAYTGTAGVDASLTVDGVPLTSASNTVSDAIPGVTFQLLEPSAVGEQVQVVIANNNSGVESTMEQLVSDYNSLISAMNTQQGVDSSGNAEPLFGSPTLSLLQQQVLASLNAANPNGNLTSISSTTNTTLAGSMSVQVGSGVTEHIVVGAKPGSPADNTFYTGSGNNTISDLAATINAAAQPFTLNFNTIAGNNTQNSTSTVTIPGPGILDGSIGIAVGSNSAEYVQIGTQTPGSTATNVLYTGSGVNTVSGLASYINSNSTTLGVTANVVTDSGNVPTLTLTSNTAGAAGSLTITPGMEAQGFPVTANVVTSNGQSTLSLVSQTEGSSGALTVSTSMTATSQTPVTMSTTDAATQSAYSSSVSGEVPALSDVLSGSITIQTGTGSSFTISVPSSPNNNLTGLAQMINQTASIFGVSASVIQNQDGSYSLQLQSSTAGESGDLTVTSNLLDETHTTSAPITYTNSSDVNSLTALGVSLGNDGSMTLDAASMDSLLNSDFSSVVGFFQNLDSWGQSFSTMLTNAGISGTTAVLALASSSNSSIESSLNAEISKENNTISADQTSLTAEMNSANQIMQELPTQLTGVNELYSAITGYNQNTNG